MRSSSQRNKEGLVADIVHPDKRDAQKIQKHDPEFPISYKTRIAIGGLFVLLIIASIFFALDIKDSATNAYRGFRGLVDDITSFGSSNFESSLDNVEQDLGALDRKARFLSAIPKLRDVPSIIGDLQDVISIISNLSQTFGVLTGDGLSLAFEGKGEELITALKKMESDLSRLGELSDSLIVKADGFGSYNQDFDFFSETLSGLTNKLTTLITFLDSNDDKRLILLFENPSELRPAGGFAGSYGELVLNKGSIKKLEVNDIYYPDKFLARNIIPPKQLQNITPDWGARDTNWFFDFSDSAPKLIELLEASDIYKKESIHFDGVIAINVRVVEDILRLTGPIDIPEYNMSLDYRNFLREIQEQVDSDRVPGENPKEVLRYAMPKIIEALSSIKEDRKSDLMQMFLERAHNKDIKFYFEEPQMEEMVIDSGTAGRDYDLDSKFIGDYLAVVNANVAGGKTDVFVDQRVVLKSEIMESGLVSNDISISRKHKGGNEPEYFYNQINQNFLKIFTVPTAKLEYIEGGAKKEIRQLVNYTQAGWVKDPDLSELENTRTLLSVLPDGYAEQYSYSGKNIFGTWFNIKPGESKTLEMKYTGNAIPLVDGQEYHFVLDKQSGSEMDFEYVVALPEGFYWSETGNNLFRFRENNLPAQIDLKATIKAR